jgi:hypothetical protein
MILPGGNQSQISQDGGFVQGQDGLQQTHSSACSRQEQQHLAPALTCLRMRNRWHA